MVFENRNKEYGSYQLRKKYYIRLGIGFIASLMFVLMIALGYFWYLNAAGDENLYYYQSSTSNLKTIHGSLLTREELDAYTGAPAQPEKPSDNQQLKPSSDPLHNFIVSENPTQDTFRPPDEPSQQTTNFEDMGLLVNDSTAFGGFLSGGEGSGGIYDRIPEFPGGDAHRYVEKNLRYPLMAIKQKIHGVVIVSFVINKTGHVTNVKVEKGINPIIDQEAVKTIKNMPPWKPGMMNGKPINFLFRMPINFVPLS